MLDFTLWHHLTHSSHMTTHSRVIVIFWLVDCFMTHDYNIIWCNDFRTWLILWVMGFTHVTRLSTWLGLWVLIGYRNVGNDSYESSMDFALWLTMSHRGLCSARWWVTRVRVVGRCLYKALGSDQEIGSSRNHLSTFLYSRYCNTITLYSLYIHSSSTRA